MKRLIISLLLLLAVSGICVFGVNYTGNVYKNVARELTLGRECMENGDAAGAKEAVKRAEEYFYSAEQYLAAFVDSGLLDEAGRALAAVPPLASEESREEFLSHLRQAEITLKHIYNDQQLLPGNFF